MSQRILLFTTLIINLVYAQAQTCLPDGVHLSHQSQVDLFEEQYPGCREIIGGVTIESSEEDPIRDLKGLSRISHLGSFLEIRDNPAIVSLSGLESLSEIAGRLTISGNNALINLNGLENLRYAGESLGISSNRALENVNALSQLIKIRGDLSLSDNNEMISLSGFSNLIEVEGSVLVRDNALLVDLSGFSKLQKIGGNFLIQKNARIKDFSGMEMLEKVGLDLIVEDNDFLISVNGLQRLASVGRYLQLVNNALLQDINGMKGMKSIDGLLQIYNNPLLVSLRGLDSIDALSIDNLAIISCPSLADCAVESICNFLLDHDNRHSIQENKFGCATRIQILNECDREGTSSNPGPNIIQIFPNPTSGFLRVKGFDSNAIFRVNDLHGKLIFEHILENREIDISQFPAGIYQIELISEKRNFNQFVIKV